MAEKVEKRFKLFFTGAVLLLASLCALTYAEFYMPPSFEQELLGLGALTLGGLSAIVTLFAYVSIIWQRLRRFFKSEGRQ